GTGPQANHSRPGGSRHWRRFPFSLYQLRTRDVFIPRVRATEHFDVGATLAIGPGAGDLNPLTRRLVADAGSVLRHVAGLSVHLNGALPLIFERGDQIEFL